MIALVIAAITIWGVLGWAAFAFAVYCSRDCERRRYSETAYLINKCQDFGAIIAEYRANPPKDFDHRDIDDNRSKQRGLRIRRG